VIRDDWDIPRLMAWYEYCAEHPPVQAMVQAYLRIKPRRRVPEGSTDSNALVAELRKIASLGGGVAAVPHNVLRMRRG
jgi:hypothetical protein